MNDPSDILKHLQRKGHVDVTIPGETDLYRVGLDLVRPFAGDGANYLAMSWEQLQILLQSIAGQEMDDEADFMMLVESGLTGTKIAKLLGVPKSTVYWRIKELNRAANLTSGNSEGKGPDPAPKTP